MSLRNKHILVGVTGGIAAYKTCELIRLLVQAQVEVRVVMTRAATEFVTPLTFQALSGNPVHTALLDSTAEAAMGHIELSRWADAVLVAPASADFMAKVAHGQADDLLSTLCLATEAPLSLAPAMNRVMWRNPATQANRKRLLDRGIHLFGPGAGEQACGETGEGRMLEPEALRDALEATFQTGRLAGIPIVITAGPTRETIDPVRFLSNRSSGGMGFALAVAAAEAGAEVTLVSGPVTLATPRGVTRIDVESAREMRAAVMQSVHQCRIFIGCAAVADYRPKMTAVEKAAKGRNLSLELIQNPDILSEVAQLESAPFTLGFAAETHDLERRAKQKLEAKNIDMIAGNQVGSADRGFDADTNAIELYWAGGQRSLALQSKPRLACELIDILADRYAAAGRYNKVTRIG